MPRPIKIFLIEDDVDDADLLSEIISGEKENNFTIDQVSHLKDALVQIPQGQYDVIIADLFLPDSRGVETFFRVQKCAGSTPILVLTGLDDKAIALETLRQGAQDYLVKGHFNGPFLVKSIQYAIERNKILREFAHATEQLNRANLKLDRLAHKDPLTDLLNRRGFQQVLTREVAWAKRHGLSLMVLIIDLDDFKKINDSVGHAAGDGVLKEIAARIQGPLRSTDFAARVGGDEFLVLLPDTEAAEGVGIAEKIRKNISEKIISIPPHSLKITASVGVSAVSGQTSSIGEVLSDTHDVLYKSKRSGKNQVSFDKGEKMARPEKAQRFLQELKKENQFHAVTQPIVDVVENKVVGFEFLARSSVPSFENPEDFFRISGETNALLEVDSRCLLACLEKSRSLPLRYRRHINVSSSIVAELSVPRLSEFFHGTEGAEFCLEISHKQIIGDPSYLVEPLENLRKAGFLIAMENVGIGQNNLESIVLLEPDYLKIDRRFILGIGRDEARQRSLNRVLKMVESLGIAVIAHGVESLEDLEVLKSAGIKFAEGFLWGKPSPVPDLFPFVNGLMARSKEVA